MTLVTPKESDKKTVREQLDRILHSGPFRHAPRRQRFLTYIINEIMAGRGEKLKGYNIGLEVFDRPDTFDPNADPIVRIEAASLREKLREYYETEGRDDPVHIELPKGTYAPQIEISGAPRNISRGAAQPTQSAPPTLPSIAVLAFDDLSTGQNLSHLGDGVAEDIITALSRFPDFLVVARNSSFTYKGKPVDVRQIGKELGVGYVVEGSVRKEGDKLRIVAQLIDSKSGKHVWAERFDRSGADPWSLQDEITGMIVSTLTGEKGILKQAQYREVWGKDATTLEEYDYYLRGHEQLMKYTKEGIERSGAIWREGLVKFPTSPLLSVKLGWHHMVRAYAFVSDDPHIDIQQAREFARRVLTNEHLSPQVARLAHWLMSYILVYERDFEGALAAAEKTLMLAPHDMFVLSRLMMVLVQIGRADDALRWADQVAARDPSLGWSYNYGRGWAYLALNRFEDAIDVLRQTDFNDTHLLSAIAYVRLKRLPEARAEVRKMMKRNPAITLSLWWRGYSFRDPSILDACSQDLVQAGLPENEASSVA